MKAGCECYLESMESNDSDYDNYYYNAIRAQLLIEDTIISIETINPQEGPHPILMICDNNPMDIRLLNDSDHLWTVTLDKYDVLLLTFRSQNRKSSPAMTSSSMP